jgi:hypothetical protein
VTFVIEDREELAHLTPANASSMSGVAVFESGERVGRVIDATWQPGSIQVRARMNRKAAKAFERAGGVAAEATTEGVELFFSQPVGAPPLADATFMVGGGIVLWTRRWAVG